MYDVKPMQYQTTALFTHLLVCTFFKYYAYLHIAFIIYFSK